MGNNSHLTVYKASAGSGKTFRLAVRYITMLVNNPEEYRTILAVTFTNKATAEMKQRILSQLYGIGHSLKDSQPYFDAVKESVTLNDQTIRDNALLALDFILQDYSSFRVETIDSFFQSVLRGLARELGIGGNLTLELDIDAAIDEAVADARRLGIKGKETTPYLLARVQALTGGDSLEANIKLVLNNARLAALTAKALAKLE